MAALSPSRPYRAAALLALGAEALFSFRLTTPRAVMFDEVHYVPAARALLALSGPVNIEHPLLGKELIALGIRIAGDNSLGWRLMSTFAGTAVIVGVFAILWLVFGRVRTATFGALFALLNITVFIQARIAMLDGFMAAFLVLGIAALLWAMRGPARWVWPRWLLSGVLLGLAVASKWAAVPYLVYAALGLLAVRLHDARAAERSVWAALNGRAQAHWPGLPVVPALIALAAISIATYFATFWPAFHYAFEPMTLQGLLPFQARMYAEQTQVLPPHPYQSSWWTWPFDVRPIWYLYEPSDGAQRGVLMLGNPAILWGGLIAVIGCLYAWIREGAVKPGAAALLWIASFAIWPAIPKSIGFFYYYYPSSILLALPLAAVFDHYRDRRLGGWDEAYLSFATMLFVYFYPIIAATRLAGPGSYRHWMWFPSWP